MTHVIEGKWDQKTLYKTSITFFSNQNEYLDINVYISMQLTLYKAAADQRLSFRGRSRSFWGFCQSFICGLSKYKSERILTSSKPY